MSRFTSALCLPYLWVWPTESMAKRPSAVGQLPPGDLLA